jgi:hypothetical protein
MRSPIEPARITSRSRIPAPLDLPRPAPLAQLVHEKTAGNPFFVIQFVYTLADEGLLTLVRHEGR